jgi:choline kinase
MQALILAAGMGTRLGDLTAESAKCMVRLHDRSLIAYMLDGLLAAGVSRLVMVLGHGGAEVRTAIGPRYGEMPITYVYNPLYRSTNNIVSLLSAASHLEADDTLLIESDMIVDPVILRRCVAAQDPALAVVAPYERWMSGTVAMIGAGNRITGFVSRREMAPSMAASYFKTVNIYRLGREFSRGCFVPELRAYVDRVGRQRRYEEVLGQIVARKLAPVQAMTVDGAPWYEIGTADDLQAATALFS